MARSCHSHTVPFPSLGLYTSPHLMEVRERIRINGAPISQELFAKYFFDVWDRLDSTGVSVIGCHLKTGPIVRESDADLLLIS